MTMTRLLSVTLLLALTVPLSATADLKFQLAPPPAPGVAAKIGDDQITSAELYKAAGVSNAAKLFEQEEKGYELRKEWLRAVLLQKLADRDPKRGDRNVLQFLKDEVFAGLEVSDKEVNAFIQAQHFPQEKVNAQLRAGVRNYLLAGKRAAAADRWLEQRLDGTPVQLYIAPPERPLFAIHTEGAPAWGKPDAPVTLVEFADFQCPFCARGAKVVTQLKKKYGDRLRLVFKQDPLPMHAHAAKAAEASLCAEEQGEKYFWKLTDRMFENQNALDEAALKKHAAAIGLDSSKFNQCLASGRMAERVQQDVTEADNLGISATPTYFVNGRLVPGAQPLEVFVEVIEQALAHPEPAPAGS